VVLRAASVPAPTLSGSEDTVVRKNCTTLMQRGLRGCTRREVRPVRSVPRLCLIGLNGASGVGPREQIHGRIGKFGPQRRVWLASIVVE
jgi:hypothetical protein